MLFEDYFFENMVEWCQKEGFLGCKEIMPVCCDCVCDIDHSFGHCRVADPSAHYQRAAFRLAADRRQILLLRPRNRSAAHRLGNHHGRQTPFYPFLCHRSICHKKHGSACISAIVSYFRRYINSFFLAKRPPCFFFGCRMHARYISFALQQTSATVVFQQKMCYTR